MWAEQQTNTVIRTLGLVAEVTASHLSEAALRLIVRQIARYPYDAVIRALERCANECTRGLTLADIVQRIDDGRPSVEEAWARVPKSENDAACMSDEMRIAWGAARLLYYDGDHIAARMAFKEVYVRELADARASGKPPHWILSAGYDRSATDAAAIEGVTSGKISIDHARLLVSPEGSERLVRGVGIPALPAPTPDPAYQEEIRARLASTAAALAINTN